jgi:hypothetical protein
MCSGLMALVRGVIFGSISATSMLTSSPQSTKTGVAPV